MLHLRVRMVWQVWQERRFCLCSFRGMCLRNVFKTRGTKIRRTVTTTTSKQHPQRLQQRTLPFFSHFSRTREEQTSLTSSLYNRCLAFIQLLVACTQLYYPLCQLVGPSVGPSICNVLLGVYERFLHYCSCPNA